MLDVNLECRNSSKRRQPAGGVRVGLCFTGWRGFTPARPSEWRITSDLNYSNLDQCALEVFKEVSCSCCWMFLGAFIILHNQMQSASNFWNVNHLKLLPFTLFSYFMSCVLFLVQVAYWLRNASCVVILCTVTEKSKNSVQFFIIFSLLSRSEVLLNCLLNI